MLDIVFAIEKELFTSIIFWPRILDDTLAFRCFKLNNLNQS